MADAQDLKGLLLETHEEFRQLAAKHHELDDQITELASKPHLSDEEQLTEVTLKKQKLHLKDRMEEIARQYRNGMSGTPVTA
ncbi:MAG: YdcH family protein [Vicinamibacteria bacterium]